MSCSPQVEGHQAQAAALEAVARLCRLAEGDFGVDTGYICEKALGVTRSLGGQVIMQGEAARFSAAVFRS